MDKLGGQTLLHTLNTNEHIQLLKFDCAYLIIASMFFKKKKSGMRSLELLKCSHNTILPSSGWVSIYTLIRYRPISFDHIYYTSYSIFVTTAVIIICSLDLLLCTISLSYNILEIWIMRTQGNVIKVTSNKYVSWTAVNCIFIWTCCISFAWVASCILLFDLTNVITPQEDGLITNKARFSKGHNHF